MLKLQQRRSARRRHTKDANKTTGRGGISSETTTTTTTTTTTPLEAAVESGEMDRSTSSKAKRIHKTFRESNSDTAAPKEHQNVRRDNGHVVDPDVERSLLGMRYAALFGETKDFDKMLQVSTEEASNLCGIDMLHVEERSRSQLTERLLRSERRNADLEDANRRLRDKLQELEAEIDRCNADLVRERRQFQKRLLMLAESKYSATRGIGDAFVTTLVTQNTRDKRREQRRKDKDADSAAFFPGPFAGPGLTVKDLDEREAFTKSLEREAQDMQEVLREARRAKEIFAKEMGRLRHEQDKIRQERRQLRDLSTTYATQLGIAVPKIVELDDEETNGGTYGECFRVDNHEYTRVRTRNLALEMNVENVLRDLQRKHGDETRTLVANQRTQIDRLVEGVRELDVIYDTNATDMSALATAFANLLPKALANPEKNVASTSSAADRDDGRLRVEVQDLRATVAALRARMKKTGHELVSSTFSSPFVAKHDVSKKKSPSRSAMESRLRELELQVRDMHESREKERGVARKRGELVRSLRNKLRRLHLASRKKDGIRRSLEGSTSPGTLPGE